MKVLRAPQILLAEDMATHKVFLAGGITGCPPWQEYACEALSDLSDRFMVLDPRRSDWDENASDELIFEQIRWEYSHLRLASAYVFWFPHHTQCPITLFELGGRLEYHMPLFIGCDPDYVRIKDVQMQVELRQPHNTVYTSLDEVLAEVKRWAEKLVSPWQR